MRERKRGREEGREGGVRAEENLHTEQVSEGGERKREGRRRGRTY